MVESAERLARIHAEERRLDQPFLEGTLIATSWGALLVSAPVDALFCNAQLHVFAERAAGAAQLRMYLRGQSTALARVLLTAIGWTLAA